LQFANRGNELVFLVLNTGETIHLAPRDVSRDIEPFEIERNARLERLVALGAITPLPERAQ